jgi:hypothetical protein
LLVVEIGVEPLQLGYTLWRELGAGLSEECVDEEAAAHPDVPVDLPDGQLHAAALQRLAPGEDVLVDAVHERAVQVE